MLLPILQFLTEHSVKGPDGWKMFVSFRLTIFGYAKFSACYF